MLNHHDVHAIVTQIAQTLDCPSCKTRILPHNINITDVVESDCLFDAACHRCDTEMSLSAHVEKTQSEQSRTFNRSSQIMHDSVVTEGVSIEEVHAIKDELNNFCGSFIETFAASYY